MLLTSLLAAFVTLGLACSGGEVGLPQCNDLPGKTYYSHAVVIGKILNLFPTGPQACTVNMKVSCVVKDLYGLIHAPTIDITEAGISGGSCPYAVFQKGVSYIAYLKRDGSGLYKLWTSPEESTNVKNIEVMKTCGIRPSGSSCPAPSSSYDCIPDTHDYAKDQTPVHNRDRREEHHHDHEHHKDEDLGFGHSHADHHDGQTDFTHDHDHSDHHHHDHEHHEDEDLGFGHSHADHHDGQTDFTHDHDHSDHHHEHHDDEHDHDHHGWEDFDDGKPASGVGGTTHRDVMTLASVFVILLLSFILQ